MSNPKGNVVKVNFGDRHENQSNSKKKKFSARHNCGFHLFQDIKHVIGPAENGDEQCY